MRHACRSNSFSPRQSGKSGWKKVGIFFIIGLILGIVIDQATRMRQPVEVVISQTSGADVGANSAELLPDIANETWSESKNISVRAPISGALVKSPLVVEGMERTFEQNVVIRLKDSKGTELVKTAVTGSAPDVGILGPYRAELTFEKPGTRNGTLEVFQASAKDGSEIDKVEIPVRFE